MKLLDNLKPVTEPAADAPSRRWTFWLLGVSLSILALVAASVVIVDPLLQYHKPWFGLGSVMWKEDYVNPGLAKNYDFDAAVIGGSFVQNTKVSELTKLFGVKAVKLTNSGGSVPRLNVLLDLALNKGTPKKAVFVSIPAGKFRSGVDEAAAFDGPSYLYDDTPLNDLGYWLNVDVLGHMVDLGSRAVRGKLADKTEAPWLDAANSWYPRYKNRFSKAYILQHYYPPKPKAMKPFDALLGNAKAHFEASIRPHIEAHPDTTFYFFYPPFSRLLWRDDYVGGQLASTLGIYQWVSAELLKYPNVKVFNFMNFDPYSSDLNNYKDRSHYGPDANKRMFEAMAHDEYRVTAVPTQAELDEFLAWARDYQDADIPVYVEGQSKDAPEVDDAAAMAGDQGVQF